MVPGASVDDVAPTPLTTAAEVLVATGHDPFARGALRRSLLSGWTGGGATAWLGTDTYEPVTYLTALGDPGAVGALIGDVLAELPHRQRVTVPRGTGARLPAWVGLQGTHWDFRWLPGAPPEQDGEERVVDVTADGPALEALLDAASPRTSVRPGSPLVRRWLGVRDRDGALLACAADTSAVTGVGHLSGIAVHPGARGQGLGKVVTAALARRQFAEGCDVVTLGMYADNDAGRALYDSLGFRDEHRCTSGPLEIRSRW